MLIAQDLFLFRLGCWLHRTLSYLYICLDLPLTTSLVALWLCHACLLDWTYTSDARWLGFEILWKLRYVWITFFLPEGFSKALIRCETFFYSTFLFQIRKHISDGMCECYVMYDFAWVKYLCIGFTFMVFSFIKFALFSPMHTLQVCWFSLFPPLP